MKKSRGFTLVELLAVIVILAVILVIAIPNVMKMIDKARLDSYKRTEDMLVSAAQKYMAQQGITLNTVGDTTTVSYNTDLRGNNFIDKVYDQKNKTECTSSKVIVTKITTGYTYMPILECDNYISLTNIDLLNSTGKFEKDTDNNGVADGWTAGVDVTGLSYNPKIQTINLGNIAFSGTEHFYNDKSIFLDTTNDPNIYYIYATIKNNASISYSFRLNRGYYTINSASINAYQKSIISYKGTLSDAASGTNRTKLVIGTSGSAKPQFELYEVYVLNLTALGWTAKTEPELKSLVENSK
jgi:type IV pilus assembly protein PilA